MAAFVIVFGCWRAPEARAAGQGGGPAAGLSPASLTFGTEALGGMSAPQTVTLTNTGSAELTITSIAIADHDFTETSNCPAALAPQGSCSIMVTFSPLLFGTRTASLAVTDNAPGSPQSVSLSGTGMGPAVTLSTTVLNFANQLATTTSAAQNVTLTNTGAAALTISSVTVIGTYGETNNCPVSPATLAVSASCTLMVTFQPLAGGAAAGLVEITDTASPVPQAIALNGTGSDFSLAASPTSNTVSPGASASYTVTATPVGGFNQAINFACSDLPKGASCSLSPGSLTLNGTSPGSAKLTITTTAASGAAPPPPGKFPPPIALRRVVLWALTLLLAGVAGLSLLRRGRRAGLAALVVASAIVLVMLSPACGGGGSSSSSGSSATPPGTYMVLVTGSVGGTSLSNPLSVTLVVQ